MPWVIKVEGKEIEWVRKKESKREKETCPGVGQKKKKRCSFFILKFEKRNYGLICRANFRMVEV